VIYVLFIFRAIVLDEVRVGLQSHPEAILTDCEPVESESGKLIRRRSPQTEPRPVQFQIVAQNLGPHARGHDPPEFGVEKRQIRFSFEADLIGRPPKRQAFRNADDAIAVFIELPGSQGMNPIHHVVMTTLIRRIDSGRLQYR
jgi:hypothetical protein